MENKNFCKEYVNTIKENLKKDIENLNIKPTLAIVQVGDEYASNKYIKGKMKDCDEVGIYCFLEKFDENISEKELLEQINKIQKNVNGIIVQLPLPKHINIKNVINIIDDDKDVDGFKIASNFKPCTPLGIFKLLNKITNLDGKNVCIIGRSEIVGHPMANLLITQSNATVTICNSYTKNLSMYTKNADVIISAVGKIHTITKDMVKNGAIIIDVGINMDENGKMCGDVDYNDVVDKCEFITPVPGGIGLITRVTLLENTLKAYYKY